MIGCAGNPGGVTQQPVTETSKTGQEDLDEMTVLLPQFGSTTAMGAGDDALPSHDDSPVNTKSAVQPVPETAECGTYWRLYNSDNQLQAQASMSLFGTTQLTVKPQQLEGELFELRLEESGCTGLDGAAKHRKVLAVMTMKDETMAKEATSFLWPMKRAIVPVLDLQNYQALNALDAAANNMIVLFEAQEDVLKSAFKSVEAKQDKKPAMLRSILAQNYLYDVDSEEDDFVGALVGFYTEEGHPMQSKPFQMLVNNQSIGGKDTFADGMLIGQMVVKSIPINKVLLFCDSKPKGQKTVDVSYVSLDGKLASLDDELTVYYDYPEPIKCDPIDGASADRVGNHNSGSVSVGGAQSGMK